MQQVDMWVSKPQEVEPEGLQDGGHIYVKCSNCRAILMDVWRTRPHETQLWKIKANCPFCDEKGVQDAGSFKTEIQGGFHAGGYGEMINEDEDIPSTIANFEGIVDDTFHFNVLRAKNGRPLYR